MRQLAWLRRLAPVVVAAICAGAASSAVAAAPGGQLAGTWAGVIAGHPGYRMVIVVNAHETGGSWRVNAACLGTLKLQSISNGYHHYVRRLAAGATCAGGDVDCLKRTGAKLYDAPPPTWAARGIRAAPCIALCPSGAPPHAGPRTKARN